MAKDDVIYIRIPSDLKAGAKAHALSESRSLSNWIEMLIRVELAHAKHRKILPKGEK